ncbi:hypothetical protein [Kitasatospora terrestris]|uniref:Uncharacterized protein n=1 Tax=Kitasatospora terrestris TaxID=258051 RepID=A0ABP9E7M2_9ACTN
MDDVQQVSDRAGAVLADLGPVGRCRVEVVEVPAGADLPEPGPPGGGPYGSVLEFGPADGPAPLPGLHVRVSAGADRTSVHLPFGLPPAEALCLLADRLQDWAVELTHGSPLPPCPGHPHPLSATVLDGAAVWTCPRRPDHPVAPIAGTPPAE